MRILVTGASGFVGFTTIQQIAKQGHNILAISRSLPNEEIPINVNWLQADLAYSSSYQSTLKSFAPEVIVHFAWQGIPDYSFDISLTNLNQSLALLSFVIGLGCCQKIVVSGSCFELNRLKGECSELETGTAKDDFTWAKHSLRTWLEVECLKKDIQLGWMRIFYVYGPRQRSAALIPTILKYLLEKKLPGLRTPRNANDFVFVGDVAEAFANSVDQDFPTGIYNFGVGKSISVLDVCRIAEEIVNGSDVITNELENRTRDTVPSINFWADCSRSKDFLGWSSSTDLNEGIRETLKWLKAK